LRFIKIALINGDNFTERKWCIDQSYY